MNDLNIMQQGLAMQAATLVAETVRASTPKWMGRTPIYEEDIEIRLSGSLSIAATLCVYGRWHPGYAGSLEQPEEPAGYEIDYVTLDIGGVEEDCTVCFGANVLEELARRAKDARSE